MASVSLRGIVKHYDKHAVIHGVDLEVADGEFMLFVGPSGCGKSTLLRMIAGLEEISAGQLRIGEQVANDVPPAERKLAMVFQSYALYPHMTMYENMAFALKLAGAPDMIAVRQLAEAAPLHAGSRASIVLPAARCLLFGADGRALPRPPGGGEQPAARTAELAAAGQFM